MTFLRRHGKLWIKGHTVKNDIPGGWGGTCLKQRHRCGGGRLPCGKTHKWCVYILSTLHTHYVTFTCILLTHMSGWGVPSSRIFCLIACCKDHRSLTSVSVLPNINKLLSYLERHCNRFHIYSTPFACLKNGNETRYGPCYGCSIRFGERHCSAFFTTGPNTFHV